MPSDEWITEHFTIGQIGASHMGSIPVLACRYCGAFVWDTEIHMASFHKGQG